MARTRQQAQHFITHFYNLNNLNSIYIVVDAFFEPGSASMLLGLVIVIRAHIRQFLTSPAQLRNLKSWIMSVLGNGLKLVYEYLNMKEESL